MTIGKNWYSALNFSDFERPKWPVSCHGALQRFHSNSELVFTIRTLLLTTTCHSRFFSLPYYLCQTYQLSRHIPEGRRVGEHRAATNVDVCSLIKFMWPLTNNHSITLSLTTPRVMIWALTERTLSSCMFSLLNSLFRFCHVLYCSTFQAGWRGQTYNDAQAIVRGTFISSYS